MEESKRFLRYIFEKFSLLRLIQSYALHRHLEAITIWLSVLDLVLIRIPIQNFNLFKLGLNNSIQSLISQNRKCV